jgi:hypothetical protein
MKRKIYRQGDVILKRISENPNDFDSSRAYDSVKQGFKIEGERSGHAHTIQEAKTVLVDSLEYGLRRHTGPQLVQVEQETDLTHPQHSPLRIAPGLYVAYRIRDLQRGYGD